MKKTILVILVLLLVGAGIYAWLQYRQSQEEPYGTFLVPRLEWSRFVFKEIGPDKTTLDFEMIIDNPMPVGFTIDSFTYEVSIADYAVFRSTYPKTIDFEGNDSNFIMLPITMYMDTLTYVLDSLKMSGTDSTMYGVKGYFYAEIPLLDERKFEYDQEVKAPLYKMPVTRIKDWHLKDLDLGETELVFDLEIQNYNVFPYEFKNIEYEIDLGNNMVFDGALMDKVMVGARDTSLISMPVHIDNSELLDAAWEYIKKGDDIRYDFWSRMEQVGKSNAIKDSPMILRARGRLSEVKDL